MQTNPHVALWFRKQKVLILGQGENRHEMEVSDLEIEGFNGFEDPEPVPEEEDGAHLTNDPLRQQDPLACGLAAIKREIASPTPGDIRPEAPRDVKPRLELLRAAATAHDLDNAAQPQGSAALHEFEERLALDASQVVVMTNRSDTDTEVDIDNTEEPVTKTCDDCGVTYIPCPDKRLAHRCKWSFRCSVCSWTGRSQAEMRKHEMDEHESRKPHVCIECNGRFKSRLGLRLHMRMHIKSRSTCACSACGANFDTVGNLSRHQNQCRAFIDDPIHRLALKGDRLKPFLCKLCFTSYRFKRDVQRHVVQAHTMKHEFKCDTCVSSFTTQSSLHRHLHVHRAPRPFVCSVCKARFSEPGKLLKHLNRHLSPDSNDSVMGVSGLEAVLVKRELPYMRKGVIKPDFG